jgi:hypothetical protein
MRRGRQDLLPEYLDLSGRRPSMRWLHTCEMAALPMVLSRRLKCAGLTLQSAFLVKL